MPEVGVEGQEKINAAKVLLIGAGGLGSPSALYLAASGVGEMTIIDPDVVDLSNLQRQIIHDTSSVGVPKAESAKKRIAEINPNVKVNAIQDMLNNENVRQLVREHDIIVDGTDNFQTRYLTNDACVLLGIPNVFGSVHRFEGQASVFGVPGGPCYRCLFREPPPPGLVPTCAEGGVLGVLPGVVGLVQATETVKLLLGIGEPLVGRLLLMDLLRMRFRTIEVRPDPTCPLCGTGEIRALVDYEAFCGVTPAASPGADVGAAADAPPGTASGGADGADGVPTGDADALTPAALARWLAADRPPLVLDVREPWEHAVARLPDARLVPLATLPAAAPALDPAADVVVLCHHGVRSAAAADWLRAHGFGRVWNLAGGIDRWSREVDAGVPRY
jgi:adenylyltransferase/sulfurtransferase